MSELKTPFPVCSRRKKSLAARILVKSVIYAFAIFGILFILLLFAVLGILRQENVTTAAVPTSAALEIDFNQSFSEVRGDNMLISGFSGGSTLSFYDLIKAINTAASDKRVKLLIARVSESDLGLAQIQDLRQAVRKFQAQGKKAYLFSSGFGSFGGGTSEYYLAAAFDEIWMQPNAEAGVTGISMEVPFMRGLLDKIGVTPEFYARHEFKTAMASLTDSKMPAPFKQELEALGGTIFNRFIDDVSADRKLEKNKFKQLVNQAPFAAEFALEKGLIDKIGYETDLKAAVLEQGKISTVKVEDYALGMKDGHKGQPSVALVVADGIINEGTSMDNPLQGDATVGADSVIKQIEEIAADKSIKSVVLRINSPGGSYTASSAIWYNLEKLKREKKLPLVVSMGNYAASGGYFIALAGDKILAEPSTITGSIGVLGGKMVLHDLWKKLDINWNSTSFGENAGILSANHLFSDKEKTIFNKSLDRIYEDFTLKVSESRKLNISEVDKLARGRVWSGETAVEHHLIDGLGGLDEALEAAKELGGIEADKKFRVVYYPKQKSLQEKISELLSAAPSVSIRKLQSQLGFEEDSFKVLQRLQYELMLMPMSIVY